MEQFLWTEKYRPSTVNDTILPERIKAQFREFVVQKELPNLLLAGPPGCGKTTVAKAVLEEIGCTYMVINGSLEGNIDVLRTQIKDFASSLSLMGNRKYVILDEADYLTHLTQPALRNFMEEYASNCGFILTCNYKHKIIEPIHSRCSLIDFKFSKADNQEMLKGIYSRLCHILNQEDIEYDKKVVVELIKKFYPDFRKMINELQQYSVCGKIDSGILSTLEDVQIDQVVSLMKNKEFTELRRWVDASSIEDSELYDRLYDAASKYIEPQSIPLLVLILAKYGYQSAFAANKDINLMACLVECMTELEFK